MGRTEMPRGGWIMRRKPTGQNTYSGEGTRLKKEDGSWLDVEPLRARGESKKVLFHKPRPLLKPISLGH